MPSLASAATLHPLSLDDASLRQLARSGIHAYAYRLHLQRLTGGREV